MMDLKYQIQLLENQVAELESQNDALSQKLRAAQHEVEALAATVEAWKAAFDHLFEHCESNGVFNAWDSPLDCTLLNEANSKSPQQHLRNVRVNAIENALDYMYSNTHSGNSAGDDFDLIRDYAKSVKAGEK